MLSNDLEAATLRRSPRLGSASLKRKRTEPSPARTLKRSHLLASEESSSSPRSQRHRRRHPSVFDDEYPSPPPKKENHQVCLSLLLENLTDIYLDFSVLLCKRQGKSQCYRRFFRTSHSQSYSQQIHDKFGF